MALTSGDGPNRGKSAPSPRRLPKPVDDGPRAETRREGTRRPAQREPQRSLPKPKAWNPYTDRAAWGPLFRKREFVERPPAIAPPWRSGKAAEQAYNQYQTDADTRKAQSTRTFDMYQDMAERQQKDEKRLGREARDRTETDKVLTAAEWAKLSPMQQAAAQANYDLSLAVAKDFKDQGKHTANSSQKEGGTARIQDYQDRVEELFGPDGASTFKGLQFAPNTLAFLESRGIDTKEELGGKTMDDIVSGDALIDEETFAALGKPTANDSRARDVTFAKTLAQGQLNYQEKLAAQLQRGNELLNDITGRGTNAAAAERYGANPIPAHAKMTAVRPEMLAQIDKYMEVLARPDIPMEESLGSIQADLSGVDKTEAAQIWENMIERSRMATTGEVQWFDDVDFEMRSPVEVAQALGAPTLKRLGAK